LRSPVDRFTGAGAAEGVARQQRVKKRPGLVAVALTPLSDADQPPFSGFRNPGKKEPRVADLVFVVLTVVLFAALTVLIRAVERW
jgi:hypothetical protein